MTTRRDVLGGLALGGLGTAFAGTPARAADAAPLFAGTYAAEGGGGARLVTGNGAHWHPGAAAPAVRNASWAVRAAGGRRYVVDEQSDGRIHLCGPDLTILSTTSSGGADPCHLALHPGGRWLAAANYSSGSVALIPLAADGTPGTAVVRAHPGHGRDPVRQAGAHAHWVGFTPDGRWLHAVDLGADAIFAHDVAAGPGAVKIAYQAPPGAGPRHLAWHPTRRRAYLVSELDAMLTVLDAAADGGFAQVRRVSLRPPGVSGDCFPAHVALDAQARHLYVSVRGTNVVAAFALDAHGLPTLLGYAPSGGNWPRAFRISDDGSHLLVANQRSGTLAALPVKRDGTLAPAAARVAIPGLAFIG